MTSIELDDAGSERVKDAVLDRVGHELRTPLTVAMLACEMLKTKVRAADEKAMAERAERSVKKLHDRIEEIIAFASSERIPQVFPTDLRELFAAIGRELGDERRARLRIDGGEPLLVLCDPASMKSAFKDIVLNALLFSPDHESVRVEFDAMPGFAVVRVCDRGPGVPPALRDRVFESFFQGEDVLTRTHGGLGLGLSTALSVVRAHGGSLTLFERDGGGTVVRIQLPRRD